jgi:hypothetical protein
LIMTTERANYRTCACREITLPRVGITPSNWN